jgi:hypothetical protein
MQSRLRLSAVIGTAFLNKFLLVTPLMLAGALALGPVRAETAQKRPGVSLLKQKSLADTPDGPKELLRRYGIDADVWVTQFFQGIAAGANNGVSRYGGKVDGKGIKKKPLERNNER